MHVYLIKDLQMVTRSLTLNLSWAMRIRSTPSHHLTHILILSSHLRLRLPSDHSSPGFTTKFFFMHLTCPAQLYYPWIDHPNNTW